ncbi:hypothetical protein [Draconibacterium sediminis]|uniref:Outer membrane protein beta-barrel domain-containing protein n=1 Tax=Draconibacterium sediminis TaxID=1544798 RepID=A0A0D8JDE1_9BACT|nr:hypothetical protein [Draconibacterium sediminis]KJF44950.1 hypothetical protein LH29_05880 [Draconibacterium sediminis]
MKRIYPFFALLFISYFSFAQFENFDLSKYKLPEIKRHQLDFNFSYNNNNQKHYNDDTPDHSNFDLDNDLRLDYSFDRNTPRVQSNGWGSLSTTMTLDREKYEDKEKVKDDYFNFRFNAGFQKRIYPKNDDRWFLLWSPNLNVSNSLNRDQDFLDYNNNQIEKYKTRYLTFQPRLNVGGGFGRIEQTSDARRAIYIVEDLYKKDKLNRLPDEDELIVIANRVAELRNQRFFDARLRHIYEMESLDSLLNTMELVSDNDIGYFTSLNDMWSYGHESRYSGTRLQAVVVGQLDYRFVKEKTVTDDYENSSVTIEDDNTDYNENLQFGLALSSYKPIGLKWQRYLFANVNASNYFNDSNVNAWSTDFNSFSGIISYGYDWFFNTRTYASFGVNGQYSRYDYDEEETNRYDSNSFYTGISGSLNYYFSPRLRASFRINSNYNWYQNSDSSYDKQFRFGSSASLNYAIF